MSEEAGAAPPPPTTFMLGNEYRIVVAMPYLDRRALVVAHGKATEDVLDPMATYRSHAALIGKCSKLGAQSGVSWRGGKDPAAYGTEVFDYLLSVGEADDEQAFVAAGTACFAALLASLHLVPTAAEVAAAAGESGPPKAGSTARP